jgi:type III secretion system FlhB-like substrate exporter
VRDVPVARALNDLEVGDEIPEALYEAVAEILRELWQGEANPQPPEI